MRYLLLMLAIPFFNVYAEEGPTCDRLRKLANDYELKLQNFHIPADQCSKITLETLGLKSTDTKVTLGKGFDYACKDTSAIDAQLKSLENELALIKGMESVKTEFQTGKELLAKSDVTVAKTASASFYTNLKVAAGLEIFLATSDPKGENILSMMVKSSKEEIKSPEEFDAALRAACKNISSGGISACAADQGLMKDPDVLREVMAMLKLGSDSQKKFEKKFITQLSSALTLKDGEKKFSYIDLLSQITNPGEGVLSQKDLDKINSLPTLANSKDYDFLVNMKKSVENINGAQTVIKAQNAPSRFQGYLADLKKREEWELKSKLSLMVSQFNSKIPAEAKSACESAMALTGPADDCLKKITDVDGSQKGAIDDILYEIKAGQKQLDRLNKAIKDCVPTESLDVPADCSGLVTTDKVELQDKIQILTSLKVQQMKAFPDYLNFVSMRDFALEQMYDNDCMDDEESTITCEAPDIGTISREATVLSRGTAEIIYVFNRPKEKTNIDKICDDPKSTIMFKKELCILRTEDVATKGAKSKIDDYFVPPVVPMAAKDTTKDGLMAIGQSILGSVVGLMTPTQQYVNPYANMYPYVTPVVGPMDIKDKLITPYAVQGMGMYSPTPGVRPYSSINSNVGKSSAYDFGYSSHFNSPIGW